MGSKSGLFGVLFCWRKYVMEYKLYTLVDITHVKQSRTDEDRWKEQNFNTVLQTLGIRSNIFYTQSPFMIEVKGRVVGFDTDDIIRVWRFDFGTDKDGVYESDTDPVGLLKSDFHLVPYISGLGEMMDQQYAVFNTTETGPNIVFHRK